MFNIEFIAHPENCSSERYGRIRLGSFSESFLSSLDYWTPDDYRKQWANAVNEILASSKRSALITNMLDPIHANFLTWWPMYRISDKICFQNQLLFMDRLKRPFDPRAISEFIDERNTLTEDGRKISEWRVDLNDLTGFLTNSSKR